MNAFLNEERICDRLDELHQYLENFPESKMALAFRDEIAYLESLI